MTINTFLIFLLSRNDAANEHFNNLDIVSKVIFHLESVIHSTNRSRELTRLAEVFINLSYFYTYHALNFFALLVRHSVH